MWFRRSAHLAALVCAVALAALTPVRASAQYFGRNKVQYENFHFKVLATEHFDIHYYDEEAPMAEEVARMAERWYQRFATAFGADLRGRQPLILYASHPDFEQTNAIPGELDESTGGVTESYKRRIVLPLGASLADVDHVVGHELVHAFQYDLRRRGDSKLVESEIALPLWMIEGMAEYYSLGPVDPNTAMWMRDAARTGRLPTVAKLDQSTYFPYRFGQALWAFVAARYGEERVAEIYKTAATRGITADRAFEAVLGFPADSLSREWRRVTKEWATGEGGRPAPLPANLASAPPPQNEGRLLLGPRGDRGKLNVSPSISPDGKRVAFLSERDQYSIEMFVADAASGRVLHRLTRTALDPHLTSLQFINSAGAWSPDGKRIAVATVDRGVPALAVLDPQSGRTLKQIPFRNMGEIYHPTWSPDGRQVAFSGLVGGATDLFVVDLASRKTQRLTQDLLAALQPAWSPDGRTLAFSTDRFTTNVAELRYGPMHLALYDLATGEIRPVPGADRGKNINPQWSADGSSLFFVSDRSGISDVYRVSLATGEVAQVTDVPTGVSGITGLSPAISVARGADRAVFSVFEDGGYRVHALDGSAALAGTPVRSGAVVLTGYAAPRDSAASADSTSARTMSEESIPRAAVLPPALGGAGTTAVEEASLPSDSTIHHTKYRAGLTLDSIGQIQLGVAAGAGGSVAVGGGSALFWSDMLGNHNLATQFQISSAEGGIARNLAAIVAYQDLTHRWNWSASISQIPYFSRAFDFAEDPQAGLGISQDLRYWEIQRQVAGIISYPLNRSQRVELGLGYRNIDFQSEVETQIYSLETGALISDVTTPGPADTVASIDLVEGLVATAFDNSIFGGTSPIAGQRYRFELAPVTGDLQYLGVLADFRRYQKLGGPFTFAARGMHYGRYGRDSDTDRIQPLFIGYPWMVRGYDSPSFSPNECGGGNGNDCPAFEQLFGSRAAVANLELRMGVFGPLGLFPTRAFPPVEAAAFYDAGVAWYDALEPRFLGGPRGGVSSYGTTFRVNLLGFAIAEFSLVHPNQRPLKNMYWEFALEPGF